MLGSRELILQNSAAESAFDFGFLSNTNMESKIPKNVTLAEVKSSAFIEQETKKIIQHLQPVGCSQANKVDDEFLERIKPDLTLCVLQIREALLQKFQATPTLEFLSKKQELNARRTGGSQEEEEGQVLLYYHYCDLTEPAAVRAWQWDLCCAIGLTGRIHVATEVQ